MKTTISLFPFLSVLISAMGVLSILAITFILLATPDISAVDTKEVEFSWIGAPPHVVPQLIVCEADKVRFVQRKGSNIAPVRPEISYDELIAEVIGVQALVERNGSLLVPQVKQELSNVVMRQSPANYGFSQSVISMERSNKDGIVRQKELQYYPMLLVYAEGIDSCKMADYLIGTLTNLNIGREPMLKEWRIPYQDSLPTAN